MKGLIAIVSATAVLLVVAGSAGATPPGFKPSPRLSPAASFVAGKPVTVYCAPTQAAINATVDPKYDTAGLPIQGATPVIGGDGIYLSPFACANLTAWNTKSKRIVLYNFAVSLETLAHEAELTAGVDDETTATCKAIPKIPRLVSRFFPLRKRESLHDLMGDVHDAWMAQPALYHAHAC